jgi:asparagine synthetase A
MPITIDFIESKLPEKHRAAMRNAYNNIDEDKKESFLAEAKGVIYKKETGKDRPAGNSDTSILSEYDGWGSEKPATKTLTIKDKLKPSTFKKNTSYDNKKS